MPSHFAFPFPPHPTQADIHGRVAYTAEFINKVSSKEDCLAVVWFGFGEGEHGRSLCVRAAAMSLLHSSKQQQQDQ